MDDIPFVTSFQELTDCSAREVVRDWDEILTKGASFQLNESAVTTTVGTEDVQHTSAANNLSGNLQLNSSREACDSPLPRLTKPSHSSVAMTAVILRGLRQKHSDPEISARGRAFAYFNGNSKMYLEAILMHLNAFISDQYLPCDCFVIRALRYIMSSERDSIDQAAKINGWTLEECRLQIKKYDGIKKLIQCAFADLSGPETVVSHHFGVCLNGNDPSPWAY